VRQAAIIRAASSQGTHIVALCLFVRTREKGEEGKTSTGESTSRTLLLANNYFTHRLLVCLPASVRADADDANDADATGSHHHPSVIVSSSIVISRGVHLSVCSAPSNCAGLVLTQ
jgi:hypothetical protein